jgi:hypothetical protein
LPVAEAKKLLLCDHGHDPHGEPVGVRHVRRNEIDAGLLETQQEMCIAAQSINLGDDELCAVESARLDRLGYIEEVVDGLTLNFKSQTAAPLSAGVPARELLADLLLELNEPAAALVEYRAMLSTDPNRFRSLLGEARAAKQTGDSATAHDAYRKLVALSKPVGPAPRTGRGQVLSNELKSPCGRLVGWRTGRARCLDGARHSTEPTGGGFAVRHAWQLSRSRDAGGRWAFASLYRASAVRLSELRFRIVRS